MRIIDAVVSETRMPGEIYGTSSTVGRDESDRPEGQAPRYRRQQRSVANSKSNVTRSRSHKEVSARNRGAHDSKRRSHQELEKKKEAISLQF